MLPVDPRWYQTLTDDPTASETWRDPLVLADPGGDGWHMLVCARASGAGRHNDAVPAHARSQGLHSWTLGPPVCAPGVGFGQLEVAR